MMCMRRCGIQISGTDVQRKAILLTENSDVKSVALETPLPEEAEEGRK